MPGVPVEETCKVTNTASESPLTSVGPVIERRTLVALAREHDAKASGFQRHADGAGEIDDHVTLNDPAGASRAGIGAAVRGVNHDRREFLRQRRGSGSRRRLCRSSATETRQVRPP